MRLTESRLRQIIREELAADVAADEFAADVDAAYALADTQQERMRVLQPAFAGLHNLPARMGRHGGKASNWLRQNDGLQQLMAVAPGVRRQVAAILALTDEYGDRLADRDGVPGSCCEVEGGPLGKLHEQARACGIRPRCC